MKGEEARKQAIAASAPLFQEFAENCPQENIELQIETLQKMREYSYQRRYN